MKELLTFIVHNIADDPEGIEIREETIGDQLKLTVFAPPEKIGPIIGKGGKTIKAIKRLLSVKAQDQYFTLEVEEKE
jgi:predicted RNA-binding protein YlqC (UPF0109 family)